MYRHIVCKQPLTIWEVSRRYGWQAGSQHREIMLFCWFKIVIFTLSMYAQSPWKILKQPGIPHIFFFEQSFIWINIFLNKETILLLHTNLERLKIFYWSSYFTRKWVFPFVFFESLIVIITCCIGLESWKDNYNVKLNFMTEVAVTSITWKGLTL